MDERPTQPGEATRILQRLQSGEADAAGELLAVLYGDLRRIAAGFMGDERTGHTLEPTALVHEAWLRIAPEGGAGGAAHFEGRAHFVRTAARAMRNVLVDHARARKAEKRGGDRARSPLDDVLAYYEQSEIDVLSLHETLERLSSMDPELGRLVELRFFGGQTLPEIAEVLGVSLATAERRWKVARLWLRRELPRGADSSALS